MITKEEKKRLRGLFLLSSLLWCRCFALAAGTALLSPRCRPQLRDFQVDHQEPRLAEEEDLRGFFFFFRAREELWGRAKKKKRGNRETDKKGGQNDEEEEENIKRLASCVAITSSSGVDTSADQKTPLSSSK